MLDSPLGILSSLPGTLGTLLGQESAHPRKKRRLVSGSDASSGRSPGYCLAGPVTDSPPGSLASLSGAVGSLSGALASPPGTLGSLPGTLDSLPGTLDSLPGTFGSLDR